MQLLLFSFSFSFFKSVLVTSCSLTSSPKLSGLGTVYYLIVSVVRDSGSACVAPLLQSFSQTVCYMIDLCPRKGADCKLFDVGKTRSFATSWQCA